MLSVTLAWVSVGFGRHVSELSQEDIVQSFKYRYAIGYLYQFGITLPKYSTILFYIRVFDCKWRTSAFFRANTMVAQGL